MYIKREFFDNVVKSFQIYSELCGCNCNIFNHTVSIPEVRPLTEFESKRLRNSIVRKEEIESNFQEELSIAKDFNLIKEYRYGSYSDFVVSVYKNSKKENIYLVTNNVTGERKWVRTWNEAKSMAHIGSQRYFLIENKFNNSY